MYNRLIIISNSFYRSNIYCLYSDVTGCIHVTMILHTSETFLLATDGTIALRFLHSRFHCCLRYLRLTRCPAVRRARIEYRCADAAVLLSTLSIVIFNWRID